MNPRMEMERVHPRRNHRLFAANLLIACLWAGLGQAAPARFAAFASGPASVAVDAGGAELLRLGPVAWGPSWAWAGLSGQNRVEEGATVGAFTSRLGGQTVQLDFRAARASGNRLELSYELKAEQEASLTLFIVECALGKEFEGRPVTVEADGRTRSLAYPFAKGALGARVDALRFTNRAGLCTVVRLEPPCEVAADGAARIVLAKDRLGAGERRAIKISVELPVAADWYASPAHIPDEAVAGGWYPWQATGDPGPSALGLGDWLESPAGKHGRIVRQGERLLYAGQPIRLWGLNLCYGACAPPKALAEKRAAFYRKYGVNAVRLHKFADGSGWSGIQSEDSCAEFDPAALDRMDYQVAKLKEAGIYVKLSAHFGTLKLGPADHRWVPFMDEFGPLRNGRIETPHSALYYSPELQAAHIRQITNLLAHLNPHTALTYAADPAVAFIEIVNEQSVLFFTSMNPLKASATLRRQVGARFCDWLRAKYRDADGLRQAWGPAAFDAFANDGFRFGAERLENNNILPLGNPWYWDPDQLNGSQAAKRRRLLDTLEYLAGIEREFYDRFTAAVRAAGYEGELVASNWQAGRAFSHFANLHADAQVGTVDRHNYFGGQRANASMLARAGSGTLSAGLQQVADRPFMLSEWIHVFPSEYGVEGPAIVGAYGLGLQGWDVSFMFQNGDEGSFSSRLGRSEWDVVAPQVFGLFPAVARQVLRGDVREAERAAVRRVHVPSLFQGQLTFDDRVVQGYDDKELDSVKVPARALAVSRTAVEFTDAPAETPAFPVAARDGVLTSDTRQLRWREAHDDARGFFTLDTPGTQAVVGFAEGQRQELGDVAIESQTPFAAIYLTAREPKGALRDAREILVVALARSRNSGMRFSPAGDRLLAPGKAPILMEPVAARIALRGAGPFHVFALDHDGRPTPRELPVEAGAFSLDGRRDRTPYYLIQRR